MKCREFELKNLTDIIVEEEE